MTNVSLWRYIRDDLKGIEERLSTSSELDMCKYLVNLAVEDIDQQLLTLEAKEKQIASDASSSLAK